MNKSYSLPIDPSIYLFTRQAFLSAYFVPGSVWVIEDAGAKKTGRVPASWNFQSFEMDRQAVHH